MLGRKRRCDVPVPVSEVLQSILKGAGLEKTVQEYGVIEHWKEIAGEKVAQHAEPMEIKDGVLFLKVDSAAWRTQLFALKSNLINKVNAHTGTKTVHSIYFS